MAGLLDFLGNGFDDPKSQMIMGLAQGLLSDNGSRGLAAGLGNMNAVQQNQVKNKLLEAQLQNYQSEIEARKLAAENAKNTQARRQALLDGGWVGGAAGVDGGAVGIVALARQYGIPEQVIQAEMEFNGGKKISELLDKHGSRDMQVTNGYAYDKNRVGAGFMPSMNTSASGQTSMARIGPDGLPVVSAPTGAVETFGAYQRASEGAKAGLDPFTFTPKGSSNPTLTNRGAAMGATQPGVTGAGYAGGSRDGANAESIRMMQSELSKPGNSPQDIAGIQREIARLQAQSGGFSGGIQLQSEAEKASAVDQAKADVVRNTSQQKAGKLYGQLTAGLDRAISLLGQGPTASGAGALADSTAGFFGQSTKGADVASQLDTISGWLTANVPRMEGPQSDKDTQQYRIMAAEVGNRSKPVSQRLAAAKELQVLQAKYAELNGGETNTGGATGSFGDQPKTAQTFDSKPPAHQFKGKFATGPDGKRYRSDGLIWKEVK